MDDLLDDVENDQIGPFEDELVHYNKITNESDKSLNKRDLKNILNKFELDTSDLETNDLETNDLETNDLDTSDLDTSELDKSELDNEIIEDMNFDEDFSNSIEVL
jgi:hypothetical protein